MRSMLVLAVFPILSACGNSTGGYACPAVVKPAIVVEIKDARTSVPLAQDAQGVVRDGAYVDSLRPYQETLSLQAAAERPGTYSVEVQRAGYQTWTIGGVRATSGQCGVRTATVHADLMPVTP
jgi:hypothetical protein